MDYDYDDGLERGDETPYSPAILTRPRYRNGLIANRDNWIMDNIEALHRWWRMCDAGVMVTGGPAAINKMDDFEYFCVSQWEMERDRQQVAA